MQSLSNNGKYEIEHNQIIIDCPNKVYGYPKDFKGRKLSDSNVFHCSVTKKIMVETLIYYPGVIFKRIKCDCCKQTKL